MATLQADLDEIVFRGRNQAYGAYLLRQKLTDASVRGFLFATAFFLLAFAAPLIAQFIESRIPKEVKKPVTVAYADLGDPPDVNQKDQPPPPPDVKPPPPPARAAVRFVPPKVVEEKEVDQAKTIANVDTFKNNVDVGKKDQEGDPNAIFAQGEPDGTGDAPVEIQAEKEPDPTDFVAVEKEPVAVNMDELRKAVGYPPTAKEMQIQGKVVFRIYVDKDGSYLKHIVMRSPHPILTNAVVDKLKLLRFTPGIQAGKPIRVWVTLPFDFKLL
jgi:periplasmic protein TonB